MKEIKKGELIATIFLGIIATYHLLVGVSYIFGPMEPILSSKVFGIYVFMFGFMLSAMIIIYHMAMRGIKDLKSKASQPKRER